jgi:hypothetical protein
MKKIQIFIFMLMITGLLTNDLITIDKKYDEIEKKQLTEFSDIKLSDFFNGNFSFKLNAYTEDQIALKKEMMEIKALLNFDLFQRPENNGIYFIDDHLFERFYPRDEKAIADYLEVIKTLEDQIGLDQVIVIPDKSLFLNKYLHLTMEDFADLNIISDLLEVDDYYKTDLHLTHQGAYKLYQFLEGGKSVAFEKVSDTFLGYYYNKAMAGTADEIYKISNQLTNDLTLCRLDQCYDDVYFEEALTSHDKYEYFLGGISPVSVLTNPNGEGELVIFGDSYSSSLSIFMAMNYEKVTVVDLRLIELEDALSYVGNDAKVIAVHGLKTINDATIAR